MRMHLIMMGGALSFVDNLPGKPAPGTCCDSDSHILCTAKYMRVKRQVARDRSGNGIGRQAPAPGER